MRVSFGAGVMSRHLVVDALRMAINARLPTGTLIHHSDRGGQYSSDDFRNTLTKYGIKPSMSSTGGCYDTAVVESFFAALKRDRVNRVCYRTREQARADLFAHIEVFYNRKRRHSYIGNISPDDFQRQSTGSLRTAHQRRKGSISRLWLQLRRCALSL